MRYHKIVGTGGIGVGMLFHSPVMETLGRSESRLVTISAAKDYCKQHIVLHYPAVLCRGKVQVIPIGVVGQDANGDMLCEEMRRAGMDTCAVGRSADSATMISVCLQYPDKEGCNFTAINTAANDVTPAYINEKAYNIGVDSRTIVAAIPETSLESRLALLRLGREQGAYCVLSVPAAEAEDFLKANVWGDVDLLAVNEAEGAALAGITGTPEEVFSALCNRFNIIQPHLAIIMTAGKFGAYVAEKGASCHIPAMPCAPVNTTGAGDALLGGTLAGIAFGVPLLKAHNDMYFAETPLSSAVELGTLCAGMAVECEDSIAWAVNWDNIQRRCLENHWEISNFTDYFQLAEE